MSMKPEFFCCIGAELKDEIAGSLKSSRIFMYRAAESQTIADMLADGFFNDADDLRVNDLILLYCPEQTRSNTFAKVSSISAGVVKTTKLTIDTTDLEDVFVKKDGTSIMTGALKMASGSMRGAFSPYLNGVGFWKMDSEGNITQIATLSDTQFLPATNDAINFGSSTKKWKDLYLSGSAYFDKDKVIRFNGTESNRYFDIYNTSDTLWFGSKYGSYEASLSFRAYTGAVTLYPNNDNQAIFGLPTRRWQRVYATNLCSDTNGVNLISVPNKAGTMALMSDVELAANSGSQLYTTGVWYAKMYSATTVPTGAEYDGKNYADFSQVDGDNNPIIVIYEGQSGAWVQIDTITPPATYNGYITVTSKIWDIVEQTDQQGGEVLWSYNQKTFTPYPKIVSLLDQANTDLSNLTNTGKNIANWSSNVSNCITEIPQDIQLELNAGTLTLKAGSKVYVPNGVDTFDVVTIASDVTASGSGSATTDLIIFYNQTTNAIKWDGISNCYSGGSAPTGQTDMSWYDTTNNVIKYTNNSGSTWTSGLSLPIAIVTLTSGVITKIDQVFNGFGYIGSTVFALPGLEYLCPNGRNSDGTLKNTKNKLTTCVVRTETNTSFNGKRVINITSDETIVFDSLERWFVQEQEPQRTNYNIWEKPSTNEIHQYLDGQWNKITRCVLGITTETAGKIDSFSRKQVFRALDYNDTEYVAKKGTYDSDETYAAGTVGAAITGKVDKGHEVIEFQAPTSQNNYNWYRKYADGWVEQGGVVDKGSDVRDLSSTVNLSVEMANNFYSISLIGSAEGGGTVSMCTGAKSQLSTSFFAYCFGFGNTDMARYIIWRVEGMGA